MNKEALELMKRKMLEKKQPVVEKLVENEESNHPAQ